MKLNVRNLYLIQKIVTQGFKRASILCTNK